MSDELARRLEQTLELWEAGVAIMRENLRRTLPEASDDVIEDALAAWLVRPEPLPEDMAAGTWPRSPRPR